MQAEIGLLGVGPRSLVLIKFGTNLSKRTGSHMQTTHGLLIYLDTQT